MRKQIAFVVGLLFSFGAVRAVPPVWWINSNTRIISPTAAQNNHAPLNLGQLKHVAQQAKEHLDAALPIGAGPQVNALVAGFQSDPSSNYAPANLGQLKAVAKPFYDRLFSIGYDTRANLIARGYPATWPHRYPWDPATPVEENYTVANLGQLKMVFSFDLTGTSSEDADEDGIPDEIEGSGDTDNDGTPDSHDTDSDNDGVSDRDEATVGTNPKNADSDGDGENDSDDVYPDDPRRSRDVPIRQYVAVDVGTAHIGSPSVFDIAIDNDGKIGLGWNNDNSRVGSRINPDGTFEQVVSIPIDQVFPSGMTRHVSANCVNSSGWIGGGISDSTPDDPNDPNDESQGSTWAYVANAQGISNVTPAGPPELSTHSFASTGGLTNGGLASGTWGQTLPPGSIHYGSFIGGQVWPTILGNQYEYFDFVLGDVHEGGVVAGVRKLYETGNIEPIRQRSGVWTGGFVPIFDNALPMDAITDASYSGPGEIIAVGPHRNGTLLGCDPGEVVVNGGSFWANANNGGGPLKCLLPEVFRRQFANIIPRKLNDDGDLIFEANILEGPSPGTWSATKLFMLHRDRDLVVEMSNWIIGKFNKHGVVVKVESGLGMAYVPVEFEIHPRASTTGPLTNRVDISADDGVTKLPIRVFVVRPTSATGDPEPAGNGSEIVLSIESGQGNATLMQTTLVTTDGYAFADLQWVNAARANARKSLAGQTIPGASCRVVAKLVKLVLPENGGIIIGDPQSGLVQTRTAEMEVVPGKAHHLAGTAQSGTPNAAADGRSIREWTFDFRDQFNNAVADGSPVHWTLTGPGEIDLENSSAETSEGKAMISLRTGVISGLSDEGRVQKIAGQVDSFIATHNAPLAAITPQLATSSSSVSLDGGVVTLTATFSATNAAVADGTPVHWFTTNGKIIAPSSVVTGGQATATLSTVGGFAGTARVVVSAANVSAMKTVQFVGDANLHTQFLGERVLVGDAAASGTVATSAPDWNDRNPETPITEINEQVPYSTSVTFRVTSSSGGWVTAGGSAPVPVALLKCDKVTAGITPDFTEASGGAFTAGAEVDSTVYATGTASLRFQGTGGFSLPHKGIFDQGSECAVSFYLRPATFPTQDIPLLRKSGEFLLYLQPDGRLRGEWHTVSSFASVTTTAPLITNQWQSVRFAIDRQAVSISVNGVVVAVPVTGLRSVAGAQVVFGIGYSGYVDDFLISVGETSGGVGFSLLAGESKEVTVTADGGFFGDAGGSMPTGVLKMTVAGMPGHSLVNVDTYGEEQPVEGAPPGPFQITPQTWAVKARLPITIRPTEQSTTYTEQIAVPVPVVRKSAWGKFKVGAKSLLKGFVLGGGDDPAAIAGDFAAGMCAWGDIRDSALELARLWPGGEDPDWVNFGFSLAGLATEFAPGAGEVADFFITGAKTIYKHIAKKLPFGKALVEITKEFIQKARKNGVDDALNYLEPPQKLMFGVVDSVDVVYLRPPPLGAPWDQPSQLVASSEKQTGDLALTPILTLAKFLQAIDRFHALAKVVKNKDDVFKFGEFVVKFEDHFKTVFGKAWNHLPAGAGPSGKDTGVLEKMLRSMEELSDNTATVFKNAEPNLLDDAMAGWVSCARTGINPIELKQFVNVAKFDNYTTPMILSDIAKFGEEQTAGMAQGLKAMLNQTAAQLKANRISFGRGRLYEIKCAGHLHTNPPKVKRVLERVPKEGPQTDIDIETDEPGFYNAKTAITAGSWDLEKDMLWIELAKQRAGGNVNQVKFIVPGGADAVAQTIDQTFRKRLNELLGEAEGSDAWKRFFKAGPSAPAP